MTVSARQTTQPGAWRRLAILGAAMCAICLPPAGADAQSATAELHRIVAEYDRLLAEEDPVTAGQHGDLRAAARWPDDSPAAIAARTAKRAELQRRLNQVAANSLTGEDALNDAVLSWRLDSELRGAAFDETRAPFTSDEGFFVTATYLGDSTVLHTRAQAEAWIARLDGLPAYYAIETDNMRRGIATGFTQPRIIAEAALRTIRIAAGTPADQDHLLAPLDTLPKTMPEADRAALRARALEIVRSKVKPAEAALAGFIEHDYLPAARSTIGASDLPNGRAYYAYLVRRETTTDMTPDAVMALGQSEIARIRAAMAGEIKASGFQGDFHAFQAMLRSDPRFYLSTPQALLERASFLAKRVDGQLPRLIGRLPRLSYGVRPVPAAIAEHYTSARYFPGSPEQGVAGGLMVNTTHLDQRPLYELPALVAHEGAPGHHIQIALAQELDLPNFRRDFGPTAFVEGWALYAEQLAREMDLYQTPYERFGLLSMEMWRACRLVMDVGIHWDGWTRDRALACLRDNTALAERNMQSEVDRYISWPGQALGYKVGELRIMALRARADKAGLDERRFHDDLLDEGALPLSVLEEYLSKKDAGTFPKPVAER